LEIRKKLMKSFTWSVDLCGSEIWAVGENEERVVNGVETWCWRRVLKMKWADSKMNDNVF
jgi:hypothetical protein